MIFLVTGILVFANGGDNQGATNEKQLAVSRGFRGRHYFSAI